MVRLCPTPLWAALLAIALGGCTGQNVEGAWRGSFPLANATDCRIRLSSEHRFDLTCRKDPAWMGTGRYERSDGNLRFVFETMARRGEMMRKMPQPIEITFVGHGNSLDIEFPWKERTRWARVRL